MPDCLKPKAGDVMFVDVGVYGHSELPEYIGKDKALRKFEQFTLEHDGFQALYAETLMTKDEFTQMFPRKIYDKVCNNYQLTESSVIPCYFRLVNNFLKPFKPFRRSLIKSAELAGQKPRLS